MIPKPIDRAVDHERPKSRGRCDLRDRRDGLAAEFVCRIVDDRTNVRR